MGATPGTGSRCAGPARIQGIRADESATRAMSAMVHGVSTTNICRPVLSWSCADIFAYSYLHDLPLHPAYACSYGGQLEREALRVDVLIGDYIDPINTPGDGMGRLEWERQYYPEVR
ncbi:MAG: phosphoadenosine phosphosulfate reductase family protein [Chloroflexi bacterium]|nr:phosphoadenosine phosphosulfate reductase family protein [Chloroflexota bacterium]